MLTDKQQSDFRLTWQLIRNKYPQVHLFGSVTNGWLRVTYVTKHVKFSHTDSFDDCCEVIDRMLKRKI